MSHSLLPRRFVSFVLWLVVAGSATARAADGNARNTAMLSITDTEVRDIVSALSDDTFEGRESGSRGNRAAGIYIIERLKKCGVQGAGPKGSFYQDFGGYHNILGMLEGSDPELKKQVVVIGAHYDHVGYGNARNSLGPTGLIHNGADDNASGVAALMEIAEAVSMLPEKPRRSILFAFWDGEERGLLGSQHWVDHPTVPLDRVPVAINADMVGRLRNTTLTLYGSRTSQGLRNLISRQNDVPQLAIDFSWEMKADSDHHSFYAKRIPVLMMHTGLHGDYHRPSDDADKINVDGLQRIAQLMFGTLVELADAPTLPPFRRQVQNENRSARQLSEQALPPLPGRLGIRWDEKAAEQGEIVAAFVTPGSAADKAGIRAGDKILKFADKDVSSPTVFRVNVLSAKNPVMAQIQRTGETEPRDVTLELSGDPVRLGISWRVDNAEPQAVIINRVTPGAPADLAGLQVNDRVTKIDGQEFATSEDFRRLATSTAGAITLETERAGRVSMIEIPPLNQGATISAPATETTPSATPD